MAATKAMVRRRGTRLCGCAPFTRPTAHAHHTSATRIASVGSGGNVQPRSRLAGVGGSDGTGPWAAAGAASTTYTSAAPAATTMRETRA